MRLPVIGVTMGDPAGIGPEICLRLLDDAEVRRACAPVVFGDASVLRAAAEYCGIPAPASVFNRTEWEMRAGDLPLPAVVDLRTGGEAPVSPGRPDASTGAASYRYIEAAIRAARAGQVAAVATGPIHKEALRASGVPHAGHTEIFATLTGASRYCMMLTSEVLSCSFVTTHIGYRDVPANLSAIRILDVIELSAEAMARLRGRMPRIVVCGLNPHAGEHGLFGEGEEEKIITPAVDAARAMGYDVSGPVPPDAAFLPGRRAVTDVFVCMYHDQGHIPIKAIAFDRAVNVTLGLPIIRTSVDHGTALDLAWKGRADPTSLKNAVILATSLAAGKSSEEG